MAHPQYLDEPKEGETFTDAQFQRYWWADTWRDLYHHYEHQLYKQRDIRHGLLEGLSQREPLVIYEA